MRLNDVDPTALTGAVARRPIRFQTKDVSGDPEVLKAHATWTRDRNYHAIVGRWLSINHTELGIEEVAKGGRRGSTWEKNSAPSPRPASTAEVGTRRGLGPQYHGDSAFRARMRRHQSWWREEILGVPYGTGPDRQSTSLYGNMLDDDGAARLLNFLNDDIRAVYRERAAGPGGVEAFRATRNLLSSQPMAFNLFGYLSRHLELAAAVFQRIVPDLAQVTRVSMEWAPEPASAFLADRTSFDTSIEYVDTDGHPCFIGVEVKLTEPFTQTRGYDAKPRYQELTRRPGSAWKPDSWDLLPDPRWCQLWRDQLLVEALRTHQPSGYGGRGRLALIRHPLNRECEAIVATYRGFLSDRDSLLDLPLDQLGGIIESVSATAAHQQWWHAFSQRYLQLERSMQ